MTDLLVRLPNHLGDTLMTLPALERLVAAGRRPVLVGKAWASALFAAHGWPVVTVESHWRAGVRQLAALKAAHGAEMLLFTNSFSTALRARLAGMRSTGYVTDGRGLLLSRAVLVPKRLGADVHMVEYYDALAAAFLRAPLRMPPRLALLLTDAARHNARSLRQAAGVGDRYVVLCPGATGRHKGRDKAWGGFAQLTAWLVARDETVVALPGPGERERFVQALPGAIVLPEADVATFGALLADATLVVANDSGPSHLAAAVRAPLIALFGVTEVARTGPWSDHAQVVGSDDGWPTFDQVATAVAGGLATRPR